MDEFDREIEQRKQQEAYNAIPVIAYPELKAVVDKWLLVVDPGLVKLVLAVVIANRIPSDPIWVFLLAPSGGGKTEIMNGLLKCPDYYPLSQLTPNTFLSGYKSKDKPASLLLRLGTGKTLGFKDFTSLLDGNKDDLKELLGQFRDIYDGYMVKITGTGDEIPWKGKLGFIAGSTPIIEQRMATIGALGERFLNYKVKQPIRKDLRAKMKLNIGKEGNMREEIQDAFAGYLKGVSIPQLLPVIPEVVHSSIESMSDFISVSRAVVMRAHDTKQEIEYIVEPEMSSRTYKQLYTLATALIIMNGGTWEAEDDYILKRLAISSVHSVRYNLIRAVMSYSTQVKTTTLAMELGYPTSTTRRYLEDLSAISMDEGRVKILRRTHQGKGKPDLWEVTPEMKEILSSMGEVIESTKTDSGFELEEEDVPVGAVAGNGLAQEEEDKEYDDVLKKKPNIGLPW